ncbi:MAG: hypothetical protein BWY77_01140 [bacterium ADurb.Bin431]|nr:MAG: hypothetical protein BWY77_01140 [bacterium ADurb.Bin431]
MIAVGGAGIDDPGIESDPVIGVDIDEPLGEVEGLGDGPRVQGDDAIAIAVPGDHVHVDHAEDLVAEIGDLAGIGAGADQADLLLVPEGIDHGIGHTLPTEQARRLQHGRCAAGIVVRPVGAVAGGLAVIMGADDELLLGMEIALLKGDNILAASTEIVYKRGEPVAGQLLE